MSQQELNNEELAAIEAALSSVGPKPSRLDRDRVMFLAGRASGLAEMRPRGEATRWAWPAAFGAMTAVAATLLVMVVSRPQAEVAHRAEGPRVQQQEGPEKSEAPVQPPLIEEPLRTPRAAWGGLADEDAERLHLDAPYFRELQRLLALGPEPWAPAVPSAAGGQRTAPPMPYPQLLDSLLDDPATGGPPSLRFPWESLLEPGVKS